MKATNTASCTENFPRQLNAATQNELLRLPAVCLYRLPQVLARIPVQDRHGSQEFNQDVTPVVLTLVHAQLCGVATILIA